MKLQELNEDQSPRLNDNGEPIFIEIEPWQYYNLMETPVGRKRYKLFKEESVIRQAPIVRKPAPRKRVHNQ